MSRALITGGAGFLGSHLCELFLDRGHEVICIDNLITGSRQNLAHLEGRPEFQFIEADVTACFDHASGYSLRGRSGFLVSAWSCRSRSSVLG